MKKIACVLLAVSLMLSLSVFSFADSVPPIEQTPFFVSDYVDYSPSVVPYSLINFDTGIYYNTVFDTGAYNIFPGASLVTSSGDISIGSGWRTSTNRYCFPICSYNSSSFSTTPYYWVNLIIRVSDANGNYLTPSDFGQICSFQMATPNFTSMYFQSAYLPLSSSNSYVFGDGYFQIALSSDFTASSAYGWGIGLGGSSSFTGPLSFELETLDFYFGEASQTVPPFTFGSGAHGGSGSDTPKDPNDHTQYGSASDQVEWYNDAYGAAVDPELEDKMSDATDMILQQEEIESEVIDGLNQYSSQVDPANLSFPTQILNGLSFIGTTFMGSYNALGDIGFVISLSMMLGVVLVIIGRGEGALARGMSASARERRRIEYSSQRDMDKGG